MIIDSEQKNHYCATLPEEVTLYHLTWPWRVQKMFVSLAQTVSVLHALVYNALDVNQIITISLTKPSL